MSRPLWARRLLIIAAAGVALYLIWWTTYATVHQESQYGQLAPGESTQVGGTTVRLLRLEQAGTLRSTSTLGDNAAPPGAVYVVAILEVIRADVEDYTGCTFTLVGTDRRIWSTAFITVSRDRLRCSSDEVVAGRPTEVEALFAVPQRAVGSIAGVGVEDQSKAGRTPLLTPP